MPRQCPKGAVAIEVAPMVIPTIDGTVEARYDVRVLDDKSHPALNISVELYDNPDQFNRTTYSKYQLQNVTVPPEGQRNQTATLLLGPSADKPDQPLYVGAGIFGPTPPDGTWGEQCSEGWPEVRIR